MVSNLTNIESELATFDGMSDESRVWIWQSKSTLEESQIEQARLEIQTFVTSWVSHNRALSAKAEVILGRFFVVVLDETVSGGASGCSIDSLTHAIQSIADKVEVDVMDRTTFCFYKSGEVVDVSMNELGSAISNGHITAEDLVFDNLIKTKVELNKRWLKPLQESWHYRFA